MSSKRIVCITPVRNEAWILERFLSCASTWANEIILLDQRSEDDSRNIVARFPRARLLEFPEKEFLEAERREILVDEARRAGADIILGIDADECLTGDFTSGEDFAALQRLMPGTVIKAKWLNILPGGGEVCQPDYELPIGYIDDGRTFDSRAIHGPRAPMPTGSPAYLLKNTYLLHYNFFDPDRLESKRRWYMCLERRLFPKKSIVQIFDKYNYSGVHAQMRNAPMRAEWVAYYQGQGIDMFSISREVEPISGVPVYWYDREVVDWLRSHGPAFFSRLPIWSRAWLVLSARLDRNTDPRIGADPRRWWIRAIHSFMRFGERRRFSWPVRIVFSALRQSGF